MAVGHVTVDYYETLGVTRQDSADTIKHAYRRLARKHHPDLATGSVDEAAARMALLNEAYAVLSDLEARSAYDANLDGKGTGRFQATPAAEPPRRTGPIGKSRMRDEGTGTIARAYVTRVFQELAGNKSWKRHDHKGLAFVLSDCGLRGGDWVLGGVVSRLDEKGIRNLARAVKNAVAGAKGMLKKNRFLVVASVPFLNEQRAEAAQLVEALRRAAEHADPKTQIYVALSDAAEGRAVCVGRKPEGGALEGVLGQLRVTA